MYNGKCFRYDILEGVNLHDYDIVNLEYELADVEVAMKYHEYQMKIYGNIISHDEYLNRLKIKKRILKEVIAEKILLSLSD
jgi:hypothetical protein